MFWKNLIFDGKLKIEKSKPSTIIMGRRPFKKTDRYVDGSNGSYWGIGYWLLIRN